MPTITYRHASMAGTYDVPCNIIEKVAGQYRICFRDPNIDEEVERLVERDELNFPSFGSLVM